jgi:hemoglobin
MRVEPAMPEETGAGTVGSAPPSAHSLFARFGGFARVRLLVSAFYEKVLESDRLSRHFAGVDTRRLIDHQTRFISAIMGGPASYSDDHIGRAHRGLGITPSDFEEMLLLLRETLEDHAISPADIDTIESHVLGLRERVVESAHDSGS